MLLTKQGKYAHMLETDSHTLLHIQKQSKEIRVEGGAQGISLFQARFDSFFSCSLPLSLSPLAVHHRALSSSELTHLKLQKHLLFDSIIRDCSAYCVVDYRQQELLLYGSADDIQQSLHVIDAMLAPFATVREWVDLTDSSRVSFLVGEGGAKARQLVQRTHCHCAFSKLDAKPGVELEGCLEDIEHAKAWITEQLALFDKQNVTIQLPELALPILLNNRGQQIQQIQRSTHTHITINKSLLQCTIRGKEGDVKSAESQLRETLASITTVSLPLSKYVRGAFFGAKGQHIEEIRGKHHVSVKCTEDAVCVEGVRESVQRAEMEIREWLRKHSVGVVEGEKEAVGREVIGNGGKKVKEMEKQYRLRVLQEEDKDNTRVILIGEQQVVQQVAETLTVTLRQYTATHYTLTLTPAHFLYAPRLSRSSIDQLRTRHTCCKLAVVASLGQLRCEGEATALLPLKQELQQWYEEMKDQRLFKLHVDARHYGIVIGKDGASIRELQERHRVALRLQRDDELLLVWGTEPDFEALKGDVEQRVADNEVLTESLTPSSSQLSALRVDHCRCLKEIQRQTRAVILLPARKDDRVITLSANRAGLKQARLLLNAALQGTLCYHYAYPADAMKLLLSQPSFHLERIALSSHCRIQYDVRDGLTIRGEWAALHRAHKEVFEGLAQTCPTRFACVPMDAGTVRHLTTKDPKLNRTTPRVSVEWEVAERAVYIVGEAAEVKAERERVSQVVARLASENRVVKVDEELMAWLVKNKKQLRQVGEENHVSVEVFPSHGEVFVHGSAEGIVEGNMKGDVSVDGNASRNASSNASSNIMGNAEGVRRTVEWVEERVQQHRELNVQLSSSPSVVAQFVKEFGSMVKTWEERYDGEVHINKTNGTLWIRGKTREGTSDLKFVVESMLEEVELKQEVNEMEDESGAESEEVDYKSEIASLLGLGSLL